VGNHPSATCSTAETPGSRQGFFSFAAGQPRGVWAFSDRDFFSAKSRYFSPLTNEFAVSACI
jgi:hypothetical protein